MAKSAVLYESVLGKWTAHIGVGGEELGDCTVRVAGSNYWCKCKHGANWGIMVIMQVGTTL